MGVCSAKKQNGNGNTTQLNMTQPNQTPQNPTQPNPTQPNQPNPKVEAQITNQKEQEIRESTIKITEIPQNNQYGVLKEEEDVCPISKEDMELFKDDIYFKNIIKSFDDLNQIFNRMTDEFDKLSNYFLQGSDLEALK